MTDAERAEQYLSKFGHHPEELRLVDAFLEGVRSEREACKEIAEGAKIRLDKADDSFTLNHPHNIACAYIARTIAARC